MGVRWPDVEAGRGPVPHLQLLARCRRNIVVHGQYFRSARSSAGRFGGEVDGIFSCKKHKWLDLFEVASLLQASCFLTEVEGVRVVSFRAIADGRRVVLRIQKVPRARIQARASETTRVICSGFVRPKT